MTLKGILIFVGGAACGTIAGWYSCKRMYDKILDEMVEHEKKALDEVYGDPDAFVEESEPTVESGFANTRRGSFATDYASFYKKEAPAKDPADQEHPKDDGEEKVNEKKRLPRIIKAEDFGDSNYAKVYLDFYTEDQALVIADETELREIDEVKDLIGDALDKYGFSHNDEECIYVRNYDRKTDYEILKVEGRFAPAEAYDE